jgi:uncharacterized protein YbjT (DUF2867 family)
VSQPVRTDALAREARERAELAVVRRDGTLALEACDALSELFGAGYRLSVLGDPAATPARPIKMRARFEGACAACGAPIAPNDPVWGPASHRRGSSHSTTPTKLIPSVSCAVARSCACRPPR